MKLKLNTPYIIPNRPVTWSGSGKHPLKESFPKEVIFDRTTGVKYLGYICKEEFGWSESSMIKAGIYEKHSNNFFKENSYVLCKTDEEAEYIFNLVKGRCGNCTYTYRKGHNYVKIYLVDGKLYSVNSFDHILFGDDDLPQYTPQQVKDFFNIKNSNNEQVSKNDLKPRGSRTTGIAVSRGRRTASSGCRPNGKQAKLSNRTKKPSTGKVKFGNSL